MKKYIIAIALLTLIGATGSVHAFKRDCQDTKSKNYTYSVSVLSAQDYPAMCRITLTNSEKDFIRSALAKYPATTKVTRDFYLKNIKAQYNESKLRQGESKDKIMALRRVTRDFGGSEKTGRQGRRVHTVGDIRNMLDGKIRDIGSEQSAF